MQTRFFLSFFLWLFGCCLVVFFFVLGILGCLLGSLPACLQLARSRDRALACSLACLFAGIVARSLSVCSRVGRWSWNLKGCIMITSAASYDHSCCGIWLHLLHYITQGAYHMTTGAVLYDHRGCQRLHKRVVNIRFAPNGCQSGPIDRLCNKTYGFLWFSLIFMVLN